MASGASWRESDLRGPSPRPASVVAVVQHVRRALAALRGAESALVAVSAALVTLAAAVRGDVPLAARGAWCVAALAGLAAGGAWWLEHAPRRRGGSGALVLELDRRLRHQGALAAAHDAERRGADSPLARLLAQRVLARLRAREALSAVLPPLLPPVAAPVAGALLLALALAREEALAPGSASDPARLADGLLGGLERLREAAGGASGDAQALRRLEADARELQADLERGRAAPGSLERVLELERALAERAGALGASPAARRELSAVQAWLDGTREAVARALGPEAPGAAGAGQASGSVVTDAPPPGTMAPSPGPSGGATERATGRDEPAGAALGSWWPPRHDAVVERWVESRRRALAAPAD